ncbi:MAG: hypothetical protein ABSC11_03520 [Smithella sp.]|jgi:hypothetical protein
MKVTELGVKKLRASEKGVKLTNQEIIKFAYVTKEIIRYVWGKKLSNAQANCYVECFYKIQELMEIVDKKYMDRHKELCEFFRGGKRLITGKDRLRWEVYECGNN